LIDETSSDTNICLLVRAVEFAARKHRLQRRKDVDASPYINHPVALMSVLCVEADVCDVEVLCAAALHDTIEDTETTQDELKREFGKKIAGIVAELTDDKSLPKEVRKQLHGRARAAICPTPTKSQWKLKRI
jgi:GTP diphosphokinase / guanosine-3',5'-bis(diphosphate) 3'-diphosphatase